MKRIVLIGLAALLLIATALVLWRFHAMDDCLENRGIWDVNNSRCVCTPDELVAPPNRDYATYCKAVPVP
jgi:hypothetical protein